ncbi:hypothetical protein ElyMa_006300300 [Elysia marginata]|uniref:Uncharacterized protein n=1 Tax=Elysia marginata TaxID=1093978 RepID=A0AAV4HGH7_9GAST|nr:hypothetical protein ElyMa_006300300 [Elysia marginata]
MSLFSLPSVFDHHLTEDDPSPLRSVGVWQITSFILKHSFASSTASATLHYLSVVMDGYTVLTTGSSKFSGIVTNLTSPLLYSSRINFIGSFNFALWQYIASSESPGGTPSHFLKYLLILAAIYCRAADVIDEERPQKFR